MKINDLPIGTKLMWDAPNPFENYENPTSLDKTKILYTVIVAERVTNHPKGTKIRTLRSDNWMGNENQYLRYPTEIELEKYEWPKL